MSNIRVTYSGLVSLILSLVSIVPSSFFMIIITRTLTPSEFGTWNLILAWVSYVIIIEPFIGYWSTREIARNKQSGKTAVFSSAISSLIGIVIYSSIVFILTPHTDANTSTLYFAAILIPMMFLDRTLSAINLGWKPHVVNYSRMVFVSSEAILAIILVYFLNLGILGLIISVTISYSISIIIQCIFAREKIKTSFKKEFLKKWIKISWLPLYFGIQNNIYWLDITIFTIMSGSVIGVSFWTAATFVPRLITNTALMSTAVYPKLLQGDSQTHMSENLLHVFYFGFLLTALAIVFSKPALYVLNPIYENAHTITVIMSIQIFLLTLSTIFQEFLKGIEKVDINEKATFKNFIKSKLFFIPTIIIFQQIIYISTLAITLFILIQNDYSELDLVYYWSMVALFTQAPFTLYLYILVQKNFVLKLNIQSICKYLVASIVSFGITYILLENYLNYYENLFTFIPHVLIFLVFGVLCYISSTFVIDKKIRTLFYSILQEIKNK